MGPENGTWMLVRPVQHHLSELFLVKGCDRHGVTELLRKHLRDTDLVDLHVGVRCDNGPEKFKVFKSTHDFLKLSSHQPTSSIKILGTTKVKKKFGKMGIFLHPYDLTPLLSSSRIWSRSEPG